MEERTPVVGLGLHGPDMTRTVPRASASVLKHGVFSKYLLSHQGPRALSNCFGEGEARHLFLAWNPKEYSLLGNKEDQWSLIKDMEDAQ